MMKSKRWSEDVTPKRNAEVRKGGLIKHFSSVMCEHEHQTGGTEKSNQGKLMSELGKCWKESSSSVFGVISRDSGWRELVKGSG